MNAPSIQTQANEVVELFEQAELRPLSLEEIALIGGGTAVVNTI